MKRTKYITLFAVLLAVQSICGQIVPPPSRPPPPPGLPIDGGLIFLLFSGLIYGIRKIRK